MGKPMKPDDPSIRQPAEIRQDSTRNPWAVHVSGHFQAILNEGWIQVRVGNHAGRPRYRSLRWGCFVRSLPGRIERTSSRTSTALRR
jgi:hypothetical protein